MNSHSPSQTLVWSLFAIKCSSPSEEHSRYKRKPRPRDRDLNGPGCTAEDYAKLTGVRPPSMYHREPLCTPLICRRLHVPSTVKGQVDHTISRRCAAEYAPAFVHPAAQHTFTQFTNFPSTYYPLEPSEAFVGKLVRQRRRSVSEPPLALAVGDCVSAGLKAGYPAGQFSPVLSRGQPLRPQPRPRVPRHPDHGRR